MQGGSLIQDRQIGSFSVGQPRFRDCDVAEIAKRSGDLEAWKVLFRRRGLNAPADVDGAFAVLSVEPDGPTYFAVDLFAVKTLCYRQCSDQIEVAERADELAASDSGIDYQALFNYLYFHVIPSPRTIYDGVLRLPPAHCARFEAGKLEIAPYWTPKFAVKDDCRFDDLSKTFRTSLLDATATEMRDFGASEIGCFLSGGTDSSTVAGMMSNLTDRQAATYAIGFDADGYDEMEYARIAAKHFGTRHHEYYVTPDDPVRGVPLVAKHYDQPFGNSSALPAYFCARMARENGVRKMLAGDGGDELFGGNARYATNAIFEWYAHLPRSLRHKLLDRLPDLKALKFVPLGTKVAGYVRQAKMPVIERMNQYNLLLRLGVSNVLTQDFIRNVDVCAPTREQCEEWNRSSADCALNRTLAFDWRYTLAENDLPKVCGTTRMAGVSVGFPMLDRGILNFSMSLPSDYKLKGLSLRWFFKESLRGFLPDAIIRKKKHGFGLPFGVWLMQHSGLRNLAVDALASLRARGVVREKFLDDLISVYLPQHPGYFGEMVWILMMLEQWFQGARPKFKID